MSIKSIGSSEIVDYVTIWQERREKMAACIYQLFNGSNIGVQTIIIAYLTMEMQDVIQEVNNLYIFSTLYNFMTSSLTLVSHEIEQEILST